MAKITSLIFATTKKHLMFLKSKNSYYKEKNKYKSFRKHAQQMWVL